MLPCLNPFEEQIGLLAGQIPPFDYRVKPRPDMPGADLQDRALELGRLARRTQTSRLLLRDAPGLDQSIKTPEKPFAGSRP